MPTSSIHSALEFAGKGLYAELEADAAEAAPLGPVPVAPEFLDLRKALPTETFEEIFQHFEVLGYLPPGIRRLLPAGGNGVLSRVDARTAAEMTDAWETFRADAEALRDHFSRPVPPAPLPADFARPVDPLCVRAEEIRLLRSLASVDGSVTFRSMPAAEEAGLRTRVIHHLLKLHDVLPEAFPAGSPFGNESERALRSVFRFKALSAANGFELSLLNGLADFTRMAWRFAEFLEGTAITIPGPSGDDWRSSIQTQRTGLLQFRARAAEIRKGKAESWRASDEVAFTIRILQLYLWHRGHYLGELDSTWGPMAHAAFLRAIWIHAGDGENPEAEFLSVKNGQLRINYTEFIRRCEKRPDTFGLRSSSAIRAQEPAGDLFELQDAISKELLKLAPDEASPGEREENEAKVWSRIFSEVDAATAGQRANPVALRNFQTSMIRRGVRRVLEKIEAFTKEIVGKLISFASRVKAFISKLKDVITGAALQAFRFLGRALSAVTRVAKLAARRTLRIILGTPYLSVFGKDRWILTRFSFDQDATNCLGPALLPSDVKAHYAAIQAENRSLELVMRLGAAVLSAVVGFIPPLTGWRAAKLAFSVFRITWQIISEAKDSPAEKLPPGWKDALIVV